MLYIAHIAVVVNVQNAAEACDAIAETLRPSMFDWSYLKDSDGNITEPCMLPAVSSPYVEGEFTQHMQPLA